jgi:outer membrane protein OmpA-like peptidoglycan-associated protein
MTDRSGSEAGNLALSLRRAIVASRYLSTKLEELGASDPRITVENMGEYLSPVTGPINPYERKVSVLVYPKV